MLNLDNLRKGEVVKKVVKRHLFAFATLFFYIFFYIIFIIILYITFGFGLVVNFIILVMSMIMFMIFYIEWLNHELDMYVVTNKRIIGIDQISFLNRTVSECSLVDVQEVNSKTKGVFANLFDFGSVMIQTAGNASNFHMSIVPKPLQTARQILNIVEEFKKENKGSGLEK